MCPSGYLYKERFFTNANRAKKTMTHWPNSKFTGHLITPNSIKIWILKRAKVGRINGSVTRIYDKFIVRIGIERLKLK